MCALPVRQWKHTPQVTWLSAETYAPSSTTETFFPTATTVPHSSCPSVSGWSTPSDEVRRVRHPQVERHRPRVDLLPIHVEQARGCSAERAGRGVHDTNDIVAVEHEEHAEVAMDLDPAPGMVGRRNRPVRPLERELRLARHGPGPTDVLPRLEREERLGALVVERPGYRRPIEVAERPEPELHA